MDLSFIWGHHHLHLVGFWVSVDQLITSQLATPCGGDSTRSKQLATGAILGFQFGLYHVVNCPVSISRASLYAILSTFGWSDLLQILRKQAAFSFAVLCIIMFFYKILYSESVVLPGLQLGKNKSDRTRDVYAQRRPPGQTWVGSYAFPLGQQAFLPVYCSSKYLKLNMVPPDSIFSLSLETRLDCLVRRHSITTSAVRSALSSGDSRGLEKREKG